MSERDRITSGAATVAIVLALLLAAGCAGGGDAARGNAAGGDEVQARAIELARELIIVDTHIDVPYRLTEQMQDVSARTDGGDFDYPRAVEGGLNAAFMSIYVPASTQEQGGARALAEELITMVEGIAAAHPDKFAIARSPAEVRRHFAQGLLSLPLGMENGAPLEGDLANLAHFHGRGIRYITLTHSANNAICDSSYAEQRKWNGLSPFGREVVLEMNRLGVMVDVSHVSDEAFWQVMEVSRAPVIASHSSCRRFTPGFERNMSDEMIVKLAERGGVIQINFGSTFIEEQYNRESIARWFAVGKLLEEHGLTREDAEGRRLAEQYATDHPLQVATLSDVADHFDHVVQLVGVDHVGIGSDYDGVGDSLPTGLEDVSKYPNLIAALLRRGYTDQDIEKLAGANLLRVWSEVDRVAEELQRGS